jgi:cell division protease FtsH
MHRDAWLPIGMQLPGRSVVNAVVAAGVDWQLVGTARTERALIVKSELAERWLASGLLEEGLLLPFRFSDQDLFLLAGGKDRTLAPIEGAASPIDKSQALSRAAAFRNTRRIDEKTPLHDAIYTERFTRLLPTYSLSAPLPDQIVFGKWLTGGVPVSVHSQKRLRSLAGWLSYDDLADVLSTAGFAKRALELDQMASRTKLRLVGRPDLEEFFFENVIDIIENSERYSALGIDFPSAIVLHGPPGCGKTFAIERLVEHLGWPSFSIEASSVGSPYIHETSRKVADLFEQARDNAPSVLIIDEMDSFLSDRAAAGTSGNHHVEEVAEFLRQIPEASRNRVLVVGMTNRIEVIDPAILRRGRFDHVVHVGPPSEHEISALLDELVSRLPQEGTINVDTIAKLLVGRPLSDVAYIVREGARLAAKAGKAHIDQSSLHAAIQASDQRADERRSSGRVGFI